MENKSQHLLLCEPKHFTVSYVINPWMKNNLHLVNQEKALHQWKNLYQTLNHHVLVSLLNPEPNVPDLAFTANGGLVHKNRCILSHFRHRERQEEEKFFNQWFHEHGYEIAIVPKHLFFEGEGDALFDPQKELIWFGHGFRSHQGVSQILNRFFQAPVVDLQLVDPTFYHLDTCFCPLLDGYVLYYPAAFTKQSLALLESIVPAEKRIIACTADAKLMACNSILIKDNTNSPLLIMNSASDILQEQLNQLGYQIILTPVDEFLKAGGATKCLVLRV